MIVRRTRLHIDAKAYARDHDAHRSIGCHLMSIVKAVQPHMDSSYRKSSYSEETLQSMALLGFLWEHVMDNAERLEAVLSAEAIQEERRIRNLAGPGEQFWCRRCDEMMPSGEDGEIARDHCSYDHRCKGIFWTPDAYDYELWRPVEFKVTWVSANRTSETSMEIWKYVTQTQFQAWGMGGKGAEINATFACGDYSFPITPVTYRFDIEYTPKELRNNHAMLVSNAIRLGWI